MTETLSAESSAYPGVGRSPAARAGRKARRLTSGAVASTLKPLLSHRALATPPVLIAGNGRSGTSWIGEIIGKAPGALYYREPDNPTTVGVRTEEPWSTVVEPGGSSPWFEQHLGNAFAGLVVPGQVWFPQMLPQRVAARNVRVIVKSVAAYPSLEWAASRFGAEVVVVSRHPGAVVTSVRERGWFERELVRARHLVSQPHVQRVLGDRTPELASIRSDVEVSAFIWAIKECVAYEATARHDWLALRYEEVCASPIKEFERVFQRLGLVFTSGVRTAVAAQSTTHVDGAHTTSRQSDRHIDGWRQKLEAASIAEVRRVLGRFPLPYDVTW